MGRIINPTEWVGSVLRSESTLHQLSPYIGKTKSSMATSLVGQFSKPGTVVYDPFSGCGTLVLEAWTAGRNVVGNDLNPYANVLTKAKLYPYRSLAAAIDDFRKINTIVLGHVSTVDLRKVPAWVRSFFHPETLREAIAWSEILRREKRWFLLSCLLGILHHQRPGFLSYPSSHTVPYLRIKKFPQRKFPELYEYRSVASRLEAKLMRAYRRVPKLDFSIKRINYSKDASRLKPRVLVDAIISSPPYMRQLDYARDNRLRLWFVGCEDWGELEVNVSPNRENFLNLMERCFVTWRDVLKPKAYCVLVLGNECSREGQSDIPGIVNDIATQQNGGYSLVTQYSETIPNDRRVRRGLNGSSSETVLVLRTK